VRVNVPSTHVQRWALAAYVARPEPQPGEAPADLAVRTNTHNRDLWRALGDMSTAFMRAAAKVGGAPQRAEAPPPRALFARPL
jgi:hypothetical protein